MGSELERLLEDWLKTRTVEARNAVIEHCLPLRDRVARWMRRRFKYAVDLEQIESSATMGLIEAIEGFHPKDENSFEQRAVYLMRQRCLDDARSERRSQQHRVDLPLDRLPSQLPEANREAYSRLSMNTRVVLYLYYSGGMSQEKIGQVLGITQQAVSKLILQALAQVVV